jgi:hypothetical protein
MNPFKQVTVTFDPQGGTRVVWVMNQRFSDPMPHTYQLQVSLSSASTADDYQDVGLPVSNSFYAVDDTRRLAGKTLEIHYRVKLVTPNGTFYSEPASALSYLNKREWLHVRDQLRQLKKLIKKYTGCYEGLLLKRKRFGPSCTRCNDKLTDEPKDSKCPVCFGTGIVAGYFAAVPDFNIELGLEQSREKVELQAAATSRPLVIQGSAPADVLVNSRDVFVAHRSGRRWFIEAVSTLAEYRGYPTKYQLELRVAPFSDVIYKVPLEGS